MDGIGTARGGLALLASAFTVASFGVLVHFASQSFGVGMQSVLRGLIAALIIGVIIFSKKKLAKLTRKQLALVVLVGLGGFGTLVFFTTSVNETKVATAAFLLFSTSIISSSIIGVILFKEQVTISVVVAVVLACVGLLIYSGDFSSSTSIPGILSGIAAGLCDSFSNTVRKSLKGTDRNTVVFYQYGVSAVASILLVVITKEKAITHISFWPVFSIILLSILTLGMGKLLLFGFSHFNINVGSVLLSAQIFFAIILGWLFFRDEPTGSEIAGCALVVLATALTMASTKKGFSLKRKKITIEKIPTSQTG
jgi:drug/metabolite transporter (DMT)-like permease